MRDDEEFLTRWSRRKREASQALEAESQPAEPMEAQGPVRSEVPAAEPANLEVDLSSLPPVDSIDAATDISAFLRKGIPEELSRAALRRAWSADPAIRDFVGLAENAWDFTDHDAMPGFGPLDASPAELDELVSRIVGSVREVVATLPDAAAEAAERSSDRKSNPGKESAAMQATAGAQPGDASTAADVQPASAGSQPIADEKIGGEVRSVRRRTHGGALPR